MNTWYFECICVWSAFTLRRRRKFNVNLLVVHSKRSKMWNDGQCLTVAARQNLRTDWKHSCLNSAVLELQALWIHFMLFLPDLRSFYRPGFEKRKTFLSQNRKGPSQSCSRKSLQIMKQLLPKRVKTVRTNSSKSIEHRARRPKQYSACEAFCLILRQGEIMLLWSQSYAGFVTLLKTGCCEESGNSFVVSGWLRSTETRFLGGLLTNFPRW